MIITSIMQNSKFKNYYDIYIDEEYMFFLTYKGLKALKLKENENITEEQLNKIYKDHIYSRARSRAFRLLERRDMTQKEMVQKLKQTGYNEHVIDKTLAFLQEYNYINDDEYVVKYISYKIERKSLKQISIDLIKKGISKDKVSEFMENVEVCEEDIAYQLLHKKYKNIEKIDDKIKKKMIGFLMRKGYNYCIVEKALNQLFEENNK